MEVHFLILSNFLLLCFHIKIPNIWKKSWKFLLWKNVDFFVLFLLSWVLEAAGKLKQCVLI